MDDDMTADEARDLGLLDDLRAIAGRVDPVPPGAVLAARSAIAWRDLDARLAEIAYDSALETAPPAGVRGEDAPRLVTFEGPGVTVEIQVAGTGRRRRLVGQLVPAAEAQLEVEHAGAATGTRTDALGRFAVDDVAAGPVRLVVRPTAGDGTATRTAWIVL